MSRRGQGLLAEIERDALDDRVSLAMTLRKCVALGGQTRIAELRDWASSELSGFRRDDEIPEYRTIHVPLKIDGLTVAGQMRGQQISAFELPDVAHDVVSEELKLAHGVGDLQGLVRNAVRSGETSVKLSPAGSAELMTLMNHQLQGSGQTVLALYWDVSIARIDGVLEQIRTTLVRLVCEMRATMADDESMPSSEQAAQAVNVVLRGGKRHSEGYSQPIL